MRFKDTIGISYHLRKLELVLRQTIDQALGPLQLTLPKYSVLAILEEHIKLTNADLARFASVTPQTMNRILHSMEEEGLVKRQMDKASELKIFYTLTAKAKKVVCIAHTEVNEIESSMIHGVDGKDFAHFQAMLKKMDDNLIDKT